MCQRETSADEEWNALLISHAAMCLGAVEINGAQGDTHREHDRHEPLCCMGFEAEKSDWKL